MMVVFKCVIVYPARDISAFVMYFVCGESGSSLLIGSTDSMILCSRIFETVFCRYVRIVLIYFNLFSGIHLF